MSTFYREIADDIGTRILNGEFPVGSALPSENRLSTEYGVARSTIRHALAALRGQGVLTSRQGSSWTVHAARQGQDFTTLQSFAQWARSRGMEPGGEVLSSWVAPPTVSERRRLRLDPDEQVLRVVRLRTLNGRNVMLERTTYATWMTPIIQMMPIHEPSVVQAMYERFGVLTSYADNTLDAVPAGSEDARLLGVPRSSPLLRVRRESYDSSRRPIELADDRYVTGTVGFHIHTTVAANGLQRTLG